MIRQIKKWWRHRKGGELDFDQVILQAKNVGNFNTHQMEGVIAKPISIFAMYTVVALFALAVSMFSMRAYSIQVTDGQEYKSLSEQNRLNYNYIFNKRGVIYDTKGEELAWNVEQESGEFAKRRYISQPGFSHLLGFVSYPQTDSRGNYFVTEYQGKAGLESYYNKVLNGVSGKEIVEVNAFGKVLSRQAVEYPKPGSNVHISIDARIQSKLAELLSSFVKEQKFVGGAGAIINVNTGELLAYVSVPEYNSNVLADGEDRKQIAIWSTSEDKPFLNRMSGGAFAPGSIVKPYLAAGILEEELISPNFRLVTDGRLEVKNQYGEGYSYFYDARNNGVVNMYDAIAKSSNIYFMTFGGGTEKHSGLGINGMTKYLSQFGFGQPTGLEEFSEQKGFLPTPAWKKERYNEGWLLGDTYYTAIGQYSFTATPLQALVATAAVANNGYVLQPKLLLGENKTPALKNKVQVSEENMQIVRDAMRQTALRGTTQSLNLPFVTVASKSGTAERGVNRELVNSWVIGFWPYEKPKYAFVAMAEQGPREYRLAVSRVISNLLKYMSEEGIVEYF